MVEDHAATARALRRFLEASGYPVEVANDMKSALKVASTIQFEVLVCDLNLPDGTGWELREKLSARMPVKAVAFSAYGEPEHVARSKTAGLTEHIVKGASPDALVAAIARVAACA